MNLTDATAVVSYRTYYRKRNYLAWKHEADDQPLSTTGNATCPSLPSSQRETMKRISSTSDCSRRRKASRGPVPRSSLGGLDDQIRIA
jgi:hypothetical protein